MRNDASPREQRVDVPSRGRLDITAATDPVTSAADPVVSTAQPAALTPAAPPPPPPTPAVRLLVAAAPPPGYRDRLVSADGAVNTGIGVYSDCTGQTPLVRYEAAIDTCARGVTYFVGHNPGVFTGLLNQSVGSTLTYWDGAGTPNRMRITARRQSLEADGIGPPLAGSTYEFQTCLNLSGTVVWIFDAVAV